MERISPPNLSENFAARGKTPSLVNHPTDHPRTAPRVRFLLGRGQSQCCDNLSRYLKNEVRAADPPRPCRSIALMTLQRTAYPALSSKNGPPMPHRHPGPGRQRRPSSKGPHSFRMSRTQRKSVLSIRRLNMQELRFQHAFPSLYQAADRYFHRRWFPLSRCPHLDLPQWASSSCGSSTPNVELASPGLREAACQVNRLPSGVEPGPNVGRMLANPDKNGPPPHGNPQ